jgi:hypothetical protein
MPPLGRRDAAGEQFFGILRERIEAVEHEKLAALPAVEDFHRGARRVTAQARCQEDVRSSTTRRGPGIYSRSVMF